MKAACLNGDLLSRKGDARPVLTPVDPGPGESAPEIAADLRQDICAPALKCDKFGRVRISLRLDPERHLRLRLLAAHGCMSLQETLIAALDAYLGEEARNLPCDCLHGAGEAAHDNETDNETRAAGVRDPE